jgi:hypothetical protein
MTISCPNCLINKEASCSPLITTPTPPSRPIQAPLPRGRMTTTVINIPPSAPTPAPSPALIPALWFCALHQLPVLPLPKLGQPGLVGPNDFLPGPRGIVGNKDGHVHSTSFMRVRHGGLKQRDDRTSLTLLGCCGKDWGRFDALEEGPSGMQERHKLWNGSANSVPFCKTPSRLAAAASRGGS